MMLKIRRFWLGAAVVSCIFAAPIGLNQLYPLDLSRYHDVSRELRSETGQLLHVFQSRDDKWRLKADIKDVDPLFIQMLIAREDRFYYSHMGINPLAFLRAAYQSILNGRIVSGGSTLTMQAARLLEPMPRTFKAKIVQIFRAIQLERQFTKDEILSIYLTLAPYGSNLEGTRSAAYAYFGKPAKQLIPSEAALLVALPQSPRLWTREGFLPSTIDARNRVIDQSEKAQLLDVKTAVVAKNDPLPDSRFSLPRQLPHLARRLSADAPIATCFIRGSLQKKIENLALSTVKTFPPEVNMSVLVVHHPTRKVIAYAGSSDFFDANRQGQVDFIQAYRSPGSTLKPFIYGLGFDNGLLKPSTYVLDDRKRFGSYMPDNFDKTFYGMVTVREALIMSLNIPVVQLLSEIGPQRFLGALDESGIQPRFSDPQTPPGLSLALGGVGMTLEQLVTLYASLPQDGQIIPLAYTNLPAVQLPHQLVSAKSAEQLTDILAQTLTNELGQAVGDIAVKTGTSYGHRDAWAIGYNGEYVVGVWIGRPDGSTFGIGTGRTLAVPVLQNIFQFLPTDKKLKVAKLKPGELSLHEPLQTNDLHKSTPVMLFPVEGSVIECFSEDTAKPIIFSASGGKRPYAWIIDGKPFAINSWNPKLSWTPPKPGFYKITLVDAQGQSQAVQVEVQ